MTAGNDQTEPKRSTRAASQQAFQAVVTPVSAVATLDPIVQSFLDRRMERPEDSRARPSFGDGAETVCFRPFQGTAICPVLIYLHVNNDGHSEMFQALANSAHVTILSQRIEPKQGLSGADDAILAQLDAIADPKHGLDPAHVALGGDDLGALAALSFASGPHITRAKLALLIMATPVLGPPEHANQAPWPTPQRVAHAQDTAAGWMQEGGWRGELPAERLKHLPPTLLITAEIDPFRDGAERLARRMMGAERDLSAIRMLGTIHDFTVLPDLFDSRATQDAHALMVRALRRHLFD